MRGPHDQFLAGGRRSPRARQCLHVRAARPMAPLARGAEITPGRRIVAGRRTVVDLLLADVTADAVLVPLLKGLLVVFVRPDDVHVVQPFPALHIPGRRQDDDHALLDCRQVVLDAAAAERVLDAMLLLFAGQRRGDEVLAVGGAQREAGAVQRDAAFRKITFDAGRCGRLQHLAVPPVLPGLVDLLVARCTGLRADKRAGRFGRHGCRLDRADARVRRPRQHQHQEDGSAGETTPLRRQPPESMRHGRLHTAFRRPCPTGSRRSDGSGGRVGRVGWVGWVGFKTVGRSLHSTGLGVP